MTSNIFKNSMTHIKVCPSLTSSDMIKKNSGNNLVTCSNIKMVQKTRLALEALNFAIK